MKKRAAIWILVFLAAFMIYYEGFASRPDKTVRKYIEAVVDMDYEKLIDCFDPATKRAMGGITGLFSSAIGFDVADMLALTPLMSDEKIDCEILEIKVVSYTGVEEYKDMPFLYSIMGTLTGEEAWVEFHLRNKDNGEESSGRIRVKRFGMEWLLLGEDDIEYF